MERPEEKPNSSTHTISLLVENKPGVLHRIAGLFSRRGYNIASLTVGPTERREYSRMTIVVRLGSKTVEQVVRQVQKLVPVVVEASGTAGKLDALEERLRSFGIQELCRSGRIALERGFKTLAPPNLK